MLIEDTPALRARVAARIVIDGDCWLSGPRGLYARVRIGDGGPRAPRAYATRVAWVLVAGQIPDGLCVCHVCDEPACVRNDDRGVYVVNGVAHPRYGHLWLGTAADNAADKVAKGRQPRGDSHPARLHPERLARGLDHGAYTHPEARPTGLRNGSHTRPERRPWGARSGRRLHPVAYPVGEAIPSSRLTGPEVIEIRMWHAAGVSAAALARAFGVSHRTIDMIVQRITWKHL